MEPRSTRTSPVTWMSLVIAVLALMVAVTGAGYAALVVTGKDVKNSSLTGKDVKNSSLSGKDLQDSKVTGADVDESTLATVPNAAAVGGAALGQLTLGRGASSASCAITNVYGDCSTVVLVLPRAQRLLVIGTGEVAIFGAASSNQFARCRLEVDEVPTGQNQVVGWGGTAFGGGSVLPELGLTLNTITEPLAAGVHKVDLTCQQFQGTPGLLGPQLSVVALSGD
jgi:hypothetical protein